MNTAYNIWNLQKCVLSKGPFINDVTQVGERGEWFCDTMYEGVGKMPILAWQRGRGGNFGSKLRDVIYECPLNTFLFKSRKHEIQLFTILWFKIELDFQFVFVNRIANALQNNITLDISKKFCKIKLKKLFCENLYKLYFYLIYLLCVTRAGSEDRFQSSKL